MSKKLGKVACGSRWSSVIGEMVDMMRMEVACDCGRRLVCDSFTNTCECGADFNMSGDRLASRSQWGEETGESASDLLVSDDALSSSLEGGL